VIEHVFLSFLGILSAVRFSALRVNRAHAFGSLIDHLFFNVHPLSVVCNISHDL
jgi:hypothetical protein